MNSSAKGQPVLGDMTMAHVIQAIFDKICTWKRWHSGAAANQALWAELRRTGHDRGEDGSSFDVSRAIDEVGHQAITELAKAGKIQCSGKPGNLGILYAPLHVPRTAEGGPDKPKPSRRPAAKKCKHEHQANPPSQLDFLDILLARLPIHPERAAMTLRLYTGRIGYLGEDGLPVTRRRVTHPAGLPFAPSDRLLSWGLAERRFGRWEAAWPVYAARYTEEMRLSYRQHRAAWDALLAREEVTVLCFCHGPDRCHRGVLAGLLVRCGAVYEGER
jgi:hypothetical protein